MVRSIRLAHRWMVRVGERARVRSFCFAHRWTVCLGERTMMRSIRLWELFQRDPLRKGELPHQRPLFWDTASGAAFKVSDVRGVVKWLMAQMGLDPRRFGAHSLRIGGATAALAAGVSPAQIRLLGRWSSDVAELYMRMTQQSAGDFSSLVGSTAFDDIERHTFKTEELEVLPVEWNGLATDPDLFDRSDEDSN